MTWSYKIHRCTGIIEWLLQTFLYDACVYLLFSMWEVTPIHKAGTVRSYRLAGVNW